MHIATDMSAPDQQALVWRLVEKLDEQRQFPRLPLSAAISLTNYRGEQIEVTSMNLSPDGLQLRCDVAAAQVIHPHGGHVTGDNAASLKASFSLPLGLETVALVVDCELLYLTMVDSDPRCVIGLGFLRFDATGEQLLSAYLCEQMGIGACAAAG